MFKKISDAYQILQDPQKRTLYDKYGEAAFKDGAQEESEDGGGGEFGNFQSEFG